MRRRVDFRFSNWRDFYEANIKTADWLNAHGWAYSEEVALNTLADIREKLQLEPAHKLLDVGCGSGMVLQLLLPPGQNGWGVEKYRSMIDSAERFGVDIERIRIEQAEASQLPFPDHTFDRVLSYGVTMHFQTGLYASTALREMIRVCRPGGIVLVGDVLGFSEALRAAWKSHRFSVETLRALLALPVMKPIRWLLSPARLGVRAARKLRGADAEKARDQLPWRFYTHRFFKRIGRQHGCNVEILPQRILGRDRVSRMRFDVRMTKQTLLRTPPRVS